MESVENVSFYFHNFSNKFCHSHHVSETLKVVYSEVAMPIMIIALFAIYCLLGCKNCTIFDNHKQNLHT